MLCAPRCHLIQASARTRLEVRVGGIPLFLFPAASACCSAGQQPGVPLTPAVGREMHYIHMRCCRLCCCSAGGTCAVLPQADAAQGSWCSPRCLVLASGDVPFPFGKDTEGSSPPPSTSLDATAHRERPRCLSALQCPLTPCCQEGTQGSRLPGACRHAERQWGGRGHLVHPSTKLMELPALFQAALCLLLQLSSALSLTALPGSEPTSMDVHGGGCCLRSGERRAVCAWLSPCVTLRSQSGVWSLGLAHRGTACRGGFEAQMCGFLPYSARGWVGDAGGGGAPDISFPFFAVVLLQLLFSPCGMWGPRGACAQPSGVVRYPELGWAAPSLPLPWPIWLSLTGMCFPGSDLPLLQSCRSALL